VVDPRAKLQVAGKVGWNDTALRCLVVGTLVTVTGEEVQREDR
jgi:hypothetical protein